MADIDLTIDQLLLNLDNPRFDGLSSQREALERILVSQGRKLANLADDIATKGLSPAHKMLVTPAKAEKGKYIVLDGNRRTVALRILANPALLDSISELGDVTKKQLRELAKTFKPSLVEPIDAYLCENDQESRHWIEAIHTGENEGRGVVDWDGRATAHFRGKSASLKALALVESKGKLTEVELQMLKRFPITNLDRLLGTPEVREKLGLVLEEGELQSDIPIGELMRALKRVVLDIGSRKVRVTQLDSKKDRVKYIDKLGADVLPDLSKRTGTFVPIESLTAGSASAAARSGTTARHTSAIDRKALIPAGCKMHVKDPKVEEIFRELRKLPLESYPNAIAALCRVFIELSMDHYGSKETSAWSADESLKKKIEKVAADLQTKGIHKRDLQAFRRLAQNPNGALSVDRLHGVIHSRYELPAPKELRKAWDEVQHAFEKIWPIGKVA